MDAEKDGQQQPGHLNECQAEGAQGLGPTSMMLGVTPVAMGLPMTW
jgi:hypothetical protein